MITDNDLRFDTETGRYYLTEDYVYNTLGTDLNDILNDDLDTNKHTALKRNIEYVCDMVYDFIDDNAVSPESSHYVVTYDAKAHRALKSALGYQLFDFLQKGDNSMADGGSVEINARAKQTLNSAYVFHIRCLNIPSIEEW